MPIIGTGMIGTLMNDGRCRAMVLELHILSLLMAKFWRQAMEQRLQEEGVELSWLQQGVMRVLHGEGALTISELSRRFMCDPSTLVPSIDGLERKGFVQRERDLHDRRRVPVSLTGAGNALIARIEMIRDDDPFLNSLRAMGVESASQMLQLMRQMVRNLPDGETMIEKAQSRIQSYLNEVSTEATEEGEE